MAIVCLFDHHVSLICTCTAAPPQMGVILNSQSLDRCGFELPLLRWVWL